MMRSLFAKWRSSRLSLRAFGIQEGVAYAKLLYWKKKFEEETLSSKVEPGAVELVPCHVVPESDTGTGDPPQTTYEVWLSNGLCLDVPSGFNEQELRRLLQVLSSC